MSFPPGTEMFQFPGFASCVLWIQSQDTWLASPSTSHTGEDNDETSGGLPHSEIRGSKPIPGSPVLIAGYHVLHRLLLPRHPPNALIALDLTRKKKDPASLRRLLVPSAVQLVLSGQKHVSIPAFPKGKTWLVYLTWTTPPLVLRPPHPHSDTADNADYLSERCKGI